ncbi:aromatic ring-hydroxylating dioxygenase subunit alpha [Shewanella corallii]|uniref:Aromatic ring-hydroxylating dioxygenase subunit alpha n=1 Tax=Shewanella corallii TaxID=560080 RepID=A0ABT0N3N1_9GAMM|nr:aromatic ring-hydroxylating dioxygenase subunit alpha [Shewanella corallii]MCL2913061.1 aromatic ring-hydroxylating dioxygenase subunit alpha [Shewanella corallii]
MAGITTPSLLPTTYVDADVQQQEQELIFKKHWLFVGFASQLANHNDFITLEIADVPVVVQNFNGELQALLNICSHRKARLQTAASGNRPLSCPYHCWKYGKNGLLTGVPKNNTDFKLDEADRKSLSLKRFSLAQAGDFVFVRLSPEGESLPDFLGKYFNILESLSHYFCEPVHQGQYLWQSNWKLAVETVLEVYHVPGTHPDTFSKLARAEFELDQDKRHNSGHTPLQQAPKEWWQGVRSKLKLTQHPEYTEYNHFFIYPNLAVGITNGSLMSVQTYDPVTTDSCHLNFRLKMLSGAATLGQESDLPRGLKAFKKAVTANFTDFNHTILEEDRLMAEACQKNMQHTDTPGVLGQCESRLALFHAAWRQDMDKAHD